MCFSAGLGGGLLLPASETTVTTSLKVVPTLDNEVTLEVQGTVDEGTHLTLRSSGNISCTPCDL